jgi:hypothetical protein
LLLANRIEATHASDRKKLERVTQTWRIDSLVLRLDLEARLQFIFLNPGSSQGGSGGTLIRELQTFRTPLITIVFG